MATSAIGPGFLTQTAVFTGSLGASFGFVILVSLLMSAVAQLNIWRVLCRSGLRGQDVANRLVKGLGFFLAGLIALGGLAFNIGNVGCGALGFNALFGKTEVTYLHESVHSSAALRACQPAVNGELRHVKGKVLVNARCIVIKGRCGFFGNEF